MTSTIIYVIYIILLASRINMMLLQIYTRRSIRGTECSIKVKMNTLIFLSQLSQMKTADKKQITDADLNMV